MKKVVRIISEVFSVLIYLSMPAIGFMIITDHHLAYISAFGMLCGHVLFLQYKYWQTSENMRDLLSNLLSLNKSLNVVIRGKRSIRNSIKKQKSGK